MKQMMETKFDWDLIETIIYSNICNSANRFLIVLMIITVVCELGGRCVIKIIKLLATAEDDNKYEDDSAARILNKHPGQRKVVAVKRCAKCQMTLCPFSSKSWRRVINLERSQQSRSLVSITTLDVLNASWKFNLDRFIKSKTENSNSLLGILMSFQCM